MAKRAFVVKGSEISVVTAYGADYISLTDMVRGFEDGLALIEKWLRNKNTVEFLGVWERLNNPSFNSLEFGGIKIRIVYSLPDSEKLHSVFIAQPFFNQG